jgi:hypothetical protein
VPISIGSGGTDTAEGRASFIQQKSKNPNAMPLLLLNGWPSSIVEYEKVVRPA